MNTAYKVEISWLAYLVRHLNMLAELVSPRKHQAWVLLEASANGDDVEAVLLKQVVGQVGIFNHAYDADCQLVADRFLDLDGERSLVCWACMGVLQRVVAARADIQYIDTLIGQDAGELDSLVYGPGLGDLGDLLEPVGGGDAEEERHFFGDDLASLLCELDCEASAVLEATAVCVLAVVGDWGEEGVDEVAVGLAIVSIPLLGKVVFAKNLRRESQWHRSLL